MSVFEPGNGAEDDPIEEAAAALTAALERVSVRVATLSRRIDSAERQAGAAFDTDEDRARLAEALDAARAREAELDAAVETASAALEMALVQLEAGQTAEQDGGAE